MRQNRASRFNNGMLKITMVVGFILLIAVVALWGIAFDNEKAKNALVETEKYTVDLHQSLAGDTICIAINDSVVYNGRVSAENVPTLRLKGNNYNNMISISDCATGITANADLPKEESHLLIAKDSLNNITILQLQ